MDQETMDLLTRAVEALEGIMFALGDLVEDRTPIEEPLGADVVLEPAEPGKGTDY